jgi:hypothetical protein
MVFVTPGTDPGSISRALRFKRGLNSGFRRNNFCGHFDRREKSCFEGSFRASVARPGIHYQCVTPCKWIPDRGPG